MWIYGSICSSRLAQSLKRKKLDQAESGAEIEREKLTEWQSCLFQTASTSSEYKGTFSVLADLWLLFIFFVLGPEQIFVSLSFVHLCSSLQRSCFAHSPMPQVLQVKCSCVRHQLYRKWFSTPVCANSAQPWVCTGFSSSVHWSTTYFLCVIYVLVL